MYCRRAGRTARWAFAHIAATSLSPLLAPHVIASVLHVNLVGMVRCKACERFQVRQGPHRKWRGAHGESE